MDLKMVFINKIGIIELYHIDVDQIYIRLWHHFETMQLKIFLHTLSIHWNTFYIINSFIFNFPRYRLIGCETALLLKIEFSSFTTRLYMKFKYYDVFKLQNLIGNLYPIHFQCIPIHLLLEKLLFLIFLKTSCMNLKLILRRTIKLIELYNFAVLHI